jgi:hypothetical protein
MIDLDAEETDTNLKSGLTDRKKIGAGRKLSGSVRKISVRIKKRDQRRFLGCLSNHDAASRFPKFLPCQNIFDPIHGD